MGVVRREGDWRLEKQSEGVYEITFQGETQMEVYTSNATAGGDFGMMEMVPVREVSSYSEAEGLFEEKAHGGPPLGMSPSSTSGGSSSIDNGEMTDLSELPPVGVGAVFLAAGGFMSYAFWNADNSLVILIGLGFLLVGLAPFAYAAYLFRNEDWRTALNFLMEADSTDSSDSPSSSGSEKTPPPSEKLKRKLFFDRAEQECEWCEEHYDHLEVHHIEPRSEGGPNEPENLIVLCPNCHENADRGAITRSKLRAKVERQPEIQRSSGGAQTIN